jgi:hypothetical protein
MVMYDMASLQVRAEWSLSGLFRSENDLPGRLVFSLHLSQQVVLRPHQVGHFRDHLGPHPVHTRQFKRRRSNDRANYFQGVRAMQSAAGYNQPGRLAQWQSTPSTWVRSQVRSLERPPSSTNGGMIVTG